MRFTRTRAAWLIAGGPPLVFCVGVASVLFLGVPLWPHQLFYWLMVLAVFSPLVAAFVARPAWVKLLCIAWVPPAFVVALFLQFGLNHDAWVSCPPISNENAWGREISPHPEKGEVTCRYTDGTRDTTLGVTHFTVFDRLRAGR